MERFLRFLSENSPFYLASVDGTRPRLRPLGFVALHNGKLYFGLGKHKDAYRQIVANPAVEVVAANPRSEWVRIHGDAVVDDDPDVRAKAFSELPMLKDIYNKETGKEIGFFFIRGIVAEIKDVTGQTVRQVTGDGAE